MGTASRVMYSIANFFAWILVFLCVGGIVLSILSITDVFNLFEELHQYNVSFMISCIFILIVALVSISLVRIAKKKGTSKFWDVLFLVLGIVGGNIFYFLGGLFGIIAVR